MNTRLEQLLDIEKFRQNIEHDPTWEYFPLRTSYREELLTDVATEHEKHALIKDDVVTNSNVGPLKKNREEKRLRKLARSAELTDGWFGMKSQDATEEAKNTYIMLKLKKFIDPKHPAKSSEFTKMPKFYQMGTVVDGGSGEGAMHKVPRGKRESTLVDSFLKYDLEKNFSRKKFGELQQSRQKDVQFNKKLIRIRKMAKRIKNK